MKTGRPRLPDAQRKVFVGGMVPPLHRQWLLELGANNLSLGIQKAIVTAMQHLSPEQIAAEIAALPKPFSKYAPEPDRAALLASQWTAEEHAALAKLDEPDPELSQDTNPPVRAHDGTLPPLDPTVFD